MRTRFRAALPVLPALAAVLGGCSSAATANRTHAEEQWQLENSWAGRESATLANHVQLTFSDRFVKAGEAYFSPDGTRVIFQAIEKPPAGREPGEFYAMYVGTIELARGGRIKGLVDVRRISPPGSFNTCGWFDPTDPQRVIFASTRTPPASTDAPGYQRGSRNYRWRFPPECDIYAVRLNEGGQSAAALQPLITNPDAYLAECSLSPDGRHLLYCSHETGGGDLYVKDLRSNRTTLLVGAPGYDGGPFFSPDGRRICYRSDRRGDDLLQLFVADLVFDPTGRITGIGEEIQVTSNRHVNFAPYWHPDGRHLVYTSSEAGHNNYELFWVEAAAGGPGKSRLTDAHGFDGFPVISRDGKRLLWTSQRGDSSSQVWVADFLVDPDAPPG